MLNIDIFVQWCFHQEDDPGLLFSILAALLLGIGWSFLPGALYHGLRLLYPGPMDRKGAGPFLLGRLKRLGVPWVLYALVIDPVVDFRHRQATT